jgi:hypothetical protein
MNNQYKRYAKSCLLQQNGAVIVVLNRGNVQSTSIQHTVNNSDSHSYMSESMYIKISSPCRGRMEAAIVVLNRENAPSTTTKRHQ